MPLPIRWRYKLDRWRNQIASWFRPSEPVVARPQLCPACGTLVGANATRCHQCGASMKYSLAAASRSMSRFLPQASPVTYSILGLCCVLYVVSLLITIQATGLAAPTGGIGALLDLGAINSQVLFRMGGSLLLPYNLSQPWRLVMAIFLHGSLMHIGFNMWFMMDFAPAIEELYGSARFLFIFVFTGVCGYLLSSATGHPLSIGASGSLMGMVGLLLAMTSGRRSMGMLRNQLIWIVVYIAALGLMPGLNIDNFAHLGGFISGFLLGKVMVDRQPAGVEERRRATALGWTTGAVVLASFAFMLLFYFHPVGLE